MNDSFRIIILEKKNFINEVDLPFLNRFEKMRISFDKLLDNKQMMLTKRIMDEINFKYYVEKYQNQLNYQLKDLLINCWYEEIAAFIYQISINTKNNKKKIDESNENTISERVYNKISKMLPQDIISILPEYHIIKNKYFEEKKYYNLKEYINDEENKRYKISIIYTFNNIANIINGINHEMSFIVSEIKTENQLKNKINELKLRNENNKYEKKYNIFMHFEQIDTNKIQYISNFIISNFKENKYNYIFIIHIKRNFNSQYEDRIYSILDINPNINQLFIDNLNGIDIKLKDLFKKNRIIDIINDYEYEMDLDKEFQKSLIYFVQKEVNEKSNFLKNFINEESKDDFIDEFIEYMENEVEFKDNIIEKTKELIDKDYELSCRSLITDKIFKMIDTNSIDITSCLLDYIKEEIFLKYLNHILHGLEDNNFVTALLEIKNSNNNKLDENKNTFIKEKFMNIIKNIKFNKD